MPRYVAKHEQSDDLQEYLAAIKEIKIDKKSSRTAADGRGLSRSRIMRYLKKVEEAKLDVATASDELMLNMLKSSSTMGAKPIFNVEQEQALMKYILKSSDMYHGMSIKELKTLALNYAKVINIKYPDEWNAHGQASADWYYAFMRRHPKLSLRTPEQVSANRAKSFSKENVDAFFDNLSLVMTETPFEPNRIWNMDECGLPTVPTKMVKVIGRKGKKRIGKKTSAERGTNVTLALSVSASGQSIPPFYLFPRKNMKEIYMTHATLGSMGVANGSGWMTSEDFIKYMQHFIKHSNANKETPTLLLLDNHTSHLSIEAIDMAIEHGITMLSFPPHCTHRMQPLDITVFGPLKTIYAGLHHDWSNSNVGVTFDLHHVPLIADQCLDLAVTPKNIKAGFKASGVFPFNRHAFTDVDFVAAQLSGENQCDDQDEDEETQRRIVVLSSTDVAANEEVSTSEVASTSGISSASLHVTLKAVGPVKQATPAKKSNRGRKPMQTSILTSPEMVSNLQQKADNKRKKTEAQKQKDDAKANPAKQQKIRASVTPKEKQQEPPTTDEDVDDDSCIICGKKLAKKQNRNNTIHCNECDRAAHLQCVHMTGGYFTCKNCDSD